MVYDLKEFDEQTIKAFEPAEKIGLVASVNPEGPASGRPMRDGKPYRVLRSGNWFNGAQGHSRDGTHALELALASLSGIDWRKR